jgi:hypothetical protein
MSVKAGNVVKGMKVACYLVRVKHAAKLFVRFFYLILSGLYDFQD